MGYIKHDAIIVTSWKREAIELAHKKASELLGEEVTEIVLGRANAQLSFLIAPDGSKEGWKASDEASTQRQMWKNWTREQKELWIEWIHVRFGGDDSTVEIETRKEE